MRGAFASCAAAALAACSFSRELTVRPHELMKPLPQGLVNSYNVEEQLARGYIPEVLEYFATPGNRSADSTRAARVLGRALLERGDFLGCRPFLERVLAQEGRASERADAAWLLSQSAYWQGDFETAARWGRVARNEGRPVPDGWILFLASRPGERLYAGAAAGERLSSTFEFGRPSLVRISVRINEKSPETLVLDSGASLSLLTESTARRLGVEAVPGAVTAAWGLHQVEFPLKLGWARSVELGGLTLKNVPFGILPDGTLSFETASVGPFSIPGVLGAHLMKELDWRISYQQRRLWAVRLDPSLTRGSKGQNLFVRRLKPMVRVSFNQQPWSLFLLDTGSEPTMVTRGGLRRGRFGELEATFPMTLEGIGKSRVSWAKISDVTVGLERFMVRFKNLVVKEEADAIEDGVLGSSFLSNFDVEIRFGAMTVSLESPLQRLAREPEAPAPSGMPVPPR
jgi:hypothetical protein